MLKTKQDGQFLLPKERTTISNAHELHHHQPCFKSFTHANSCNFQKASLTLVARLLSAGEIE